jgi:sarcosine oxidase
MSAIQTADVIVVGLGAMGSATCFQLAARGADVIGIDQYEPPHAFGSTHGDTRVTRLAVAEGPEYVPLVRRAHELWREIERQTGARLLTQTGGLFLGPPTDPFLVQTRAIAERFGIAHRDLCNAELIERFSAFAVDSATEAYLEPEAGYVRPEAAVAAQLQLARRHGAQLRLGERVQEWSASAGGVAVRTDAGSFQAGHLVLCAGPWISELFPQGSDIFAVYRQLLFWFPIRDRYEQARELPIFVCNFGGAQEDLTQLDGIYGFPAIDGPRGGIKVARETYEETTRPDGRQHPATKQEAQEMYTRYVAPWLPWLDPEPLRTVSCLYTTTPGSRFVIDRHPEHDAVLIVSPCSGHGFKHSAAIGECVAQLVLDGLSGIDLSAFRFTAEIMGGGSRPR